MKMFMLVTVLLCVFLCSIIMWCVGVFVCLLFIGKEYNFI